MIVIVNPINWSNKIFGLYDISNGISINNINLKTIVQ